MQRRSSAGLLACGLALAAIGSACGSSEPATSPAPAASPAAPAPTEPAPPAPAGGAAGSDAIAAEGVLPDGFPSDVPVYPGAAIGSSLLMPGLGVFATLESGDAVEAILAHYRTELSAAGWSVTDSADGGGVDATKNERSVQVRARKNEQGRSEIAINISEP